MKKLLYILPLILLFISCTRNQVALNKLEGTWTLTQRRVSNINTGQNDLSYPYQTKWSFTKCKLNKSESCPGSISDTTGITDIDYTILEDGYKAEITIKGADTTTAVYDLVSYGKTEMSLALQDTDETVYTLEFLKD